MYNFERTVFNCAFKIYCFDRKINSTHFHSIECLIKPLFENNQTDPTS